MKIKHILGKGSWEKEVGDGRSFLLGNDLGDYLWLGNSPESRYQGWFVTPEEERGKIYKIIDDIRPVDRKSVEQLNNYFTSVERVGEGFKESFQLDLDSSMFIYELEDKKRIELVLDMRRSYSDDYPEYEIESFENKILVSSEGESNLYLAITGFDSFEKVEERFVRDYELDKKRSSPPFEKAVFKALILKGKKIVFSAAEDKNAALDNLEKEIKKKECRSRREPVDFVTSEVGLDNLVVNGKNIYAGFPWFFQFWQRDEAISLRGLKITQPKKAEKVFWSLLDGNTSGPRGNHVADGIGWTFKRAFLFLNDFDEEKEKKLAESLRKRVDLNPSEILKISDSKETWMDSISRKGARIEMQALQLAMYKLGKLIDKERQKDYERLEKDLKKEVRDKFWDGNILADGYIPDSGWVDKTVRPNVFLSYYIYPELLTDDEWEVCFRRALYELWLDWGGLATISKEDPRYQKKYTGENPQSYHQGDSWFFVNNLAAIAMNRLNEGKFSYEVNQILKASRADLLWNGAVGHHSELSSAEELRAEGAISQAWSFATYLEALHEIFKINNFNWD